MLTLKTDACWRASNALYIEDHGMAAADGDEVESPEG